MAPAGLEQQKRAAGRRAAELVKDGTVIGLGTGSTVAFALERIAELVAEGLDVQGVPTSHQTAIRAKRLGICLSTLDDYPTLDLAIDGADQVDPAFCLVKGRGAALVREKCVAAAADRFAVAVDAAKLVRVLDAPVPVEVIPFAVTPVMANLRGLGCTRTELREGTGKDGPVITDNGNFIVDCAFGSITSPAALEERIEAIPGVLGAGIFSRFPSRTIVLVGEPGCVRILDRPSGIL